MNIRQPFEVAGQSNKFDVSVNVIGCGVAGQADEEIDRLCEVLPAVVERLRRLNPGP